MDLETERLRIRELTLQDAPFIVELLNSEAFLVKIGDRGVGTLELAEQKINSYYTNGYPEFGLFTVELKHSHTPIGTISYLKRDYLQHDDIGYAFLPQFWNKGYALEATRSVLNHKLNSGVKEIWGVVDRTNKPSVRLLEKLNFTELGEIFMIDEQTLEYEKTPIMKMVYRA